MNFPIIEHPIFGSFNQGQEVLDSLEKYCADPKGFLLLAGANGTGKSYAARVIYHANTTFKLPFTNSDLAFFINQVDLNSEFTKSTRGDDRKQIERICKETKLLVIDDLGTRTPSDPFMDFLYTIADKRYNDSRATIITTNLNAKDMRERFGDAFVSRVASGKCFRFVGTDRRFKDF